MDDKTLLEKAARAAGYVVDGYVDDMIVQPSKEKAGGLVIRNEQGGHNLFNALADDGDALRLAVDLGLVVDCSRPSAALPFTRHAYEQADYTDQKAATRRAIVRAAAAIGSAHEAQGGQP